MDAIDLSQGSGRFAGLSLTRIARYLAPRRQRQKWRILRGFREQFLGNRTVCFDAATKQKQTEINNNENNQDNQ
jgi:hypothetical protein